MINNEFRACLLIDPVVIVISQFILPSRLLWAGWARMTALIAFVTIMICFFISKLHLPTWMVSPPISLTGFLWPERGLYSFGFTLTFFFGLIATRQMKAVVHVSNGGSLSVLACNLLIVALVGMLIQGLVPFQEDTIEMLLPGKSFPAVQTLIHLIGAAIFFLIAQLHGLLILVDRLMVNPSKLPVKVKSICLIGSVISLQLMDAKNDGDPHAAFNVAGFYQRLGVLFILIFFADYSRDVYIIQSQSVNQPDANQSIVLVSQMSASE